MNRQTMLHPMLLSVLLLPLAACNVEKPLEKARDTVARQESSINQKISKKLDEAKAELETENLSLNGGSNFIVGNNSSLIGKGNDKLPKAEISPRGELFIEGSKVALTPEQEARLLAYREQLIGIVRAGIDIGGKGAGLGLTAARVALSSLLDEGVDETQIKAEAEKLKAEARQLCTRLPALLTAQQQLATLVPAFQPYATLSVADIQECEKNIDAEASETTGNPADSDPATSKEQR